MENASKALIIVGALFVTLLIISAALYIYGSSQGLLKTTGESISDQEKLSFNQQWTYYDGEQTGDSIKDLLRKMMQNCDTNETEQYRLVGLEIDRACSSIDKSLNVEIKVVGNVDNVNFGTDTEPATYYSLLETSPLNVKLRPAEAKKMYALVRNAIETRHIYKVSQEYESRGIIDKIVISYN